MNKRIKLRFTASYRQPITFAQLYPRRTENSPPPAVSGYWLEGEQQKKIFRIKSSMAEHFFTEEDKEKMTILRGYRACKETSKSFACPSKVGTVDFIDFMMNPITF